MLGFADCGSWNLKNQVVGQTNPSLAFATPYALCSAHCHLIYFTTSLLLSPSFPPNELIIASASPPSPCLKAKKTKETPENKRKAFDVIVSHSSIFPVPAFPLYWTLNSLVLISSKQKGWESLKLPLLSIITTVAITLTQKPSLATILICFKRVHAHTWIFNFTKVPCCVKIKRFGVFFTPCLTCCN